MKCLLLVAAFFAVSLAVALPEQPKERGVFCPVCQAFVKQVETDIENGEQADEDKLNAWCEKEFGTGVMGKVCKGFVDSELEKVVDKLKNDPGATPESVCKDIDLC
ncbi:unnamed protein product, partial [Mesorhabditis spiculigera]